MSIPLCSIVINNFNYARFLAQSIDSALAQTHPRTEVVVVDDASADESQEVIRGYGDRVIAVLQESNSGQAAAFNAGFRASRGEMVLFLDSDDYLYPDAVARVVAAWGAGISKVQFRLDLIDAGGRTIDIFPAPEVSFDSGDVVPRLLATGRYETVVTSGNVFARSALERVLPVPETEFRICADGYLVTVTPFFGPVVSIDERLGAYRQHGSNQWAPSASSAADGGERLRRSLDHDEHKYKALSERAQERGLRAAASPGLRDHQHLTTRLASLCIDPAGHPYSADTRFGLALRGARWSFDARMPWKRRAIMAGWFLAAGLLPKSVAARVVAWRLVPDSRDMTIDRILKAMRRMAR
jgi:hypothetical protein